MGYISKYLCKELCDSTNATLNNFYDTDRLDDMVIYAFLFAKACYVSVTKSDFVNEVIFEMFCHKEITVQIDALGEKIHGYIDNQEAYYVELHPEIAMILYEAGVKCYESMCEQDELIVVNERPDIAITFDLFA